MALDCGSNTTGPAITTAEGFFVTYCITFLFLLLCFVPLRVYLVTGCDILCKLDCFSIFTTVFVKIFCIWNIITGLYWVACQSGHFQAPMPKFKRDKHELNQQPLQSAPLIDAYVIETKTRQTLVLEDNSPLLTPLTIKKPTLKTAKHPKSADDRTSQGETLVTQVTLLLGTTHSETSQIQHTNTPDDIFDILGTRVYQGYVETPLQTLDGIIVNQPKQFLPLAEEAKHIAKEIRIEKINEQWAGIPREQLLNKSFTDQLNSIQILEQLTPLQLAKEHLPGDIVDILKRLGKVDNIPFNQLYYIAEDCANRYYSKVIETFVSILKCQFANRQLLLVNTTWSLKFLEVYADCQLQIWKIFQKHQTIPEDFQDLHLHLDDFKNSIEKEFKFLKEATKRNVENFQNSLNLQQTYSGSLCSHVNNLYNKLAELQRQIQHHDPHMNAGDTIQIKAPDFDPDIDDVSPTTIDQESNNRLTQGTISLTSEFTELETEHIAPAPSSQCTAQQEMDWPDAIPVEILSQIDLPDYQRIDTQQTRWDSEPVKIPQLKKIRKKNNTLI